MELKKNDTVELVITGTSHDGAGVGKCGDLTVFTPDCAEGERIRAKLVSVKKGIAYAKLAEVIVASPERITSDCAVSQKCGGCAFRHISYKEELRIKHNRVMDALCKIGHLDITPESIIGCEQTDGYRNKAQYPVGMFGFDKSLLIGFYARNSHRIVNCRGCLLQPAIFGKIINAAEKWIVSEDVSVYDESTGKGLLRHIYIRQTEATGEVMLCLVINGGDIPRRDELIKQITSINAGIVSIVINMNRKNTNVILGEQCRTIWGKSSITDILCGLKIELSPLAFYQVNRRQAEVLYGIAADFARLTGNETLLDLYCGTGTIGLSLARKVKRLIGVEVIPEAIENAKTNAANNNIQNAEFICADAQEAVLKLRGTKIDVVVLDPPRKGCGAETVDAVAELCPERIVYVSCDPATLARDLELFGKKGYLTLKVQPVDMFPRTGHVECVVLLNSK